MLEQSGECLALLDATGAITWASPAMYDLHGITAGQATGQSGFAFVHPEDVPRLSEELMWRAATPGPHERKLTYRARHANGSWRNLEMRTTNLLADPNVAALVISLKDITAITRSARTAARLGGAIGAHLANAAPADVVTLLEEIGTAYVQPAHPGATVRATFDVQETIRSGRVPGGWSRVMLNPRIAFSVEGTDQPTTLDAGLMGLLLPLTEVLLTHAADRTIVAEDADAHVALIFRSNPIATATLNLEGCYTSVNPAMEAITGLPAATLLGMSWRELLHPEAPTPGDPPLTGERSDLLATRMVSRWLVPHTQRDVWLEVVATAVVSDTGRLQGHVVQYFDLSDAAGAASQMERVMADQRSQTSEVERQRLSSLLNDLAEQHEQQKAAWAERISEDAVQRLVGTRFALSGDDLDVAMAGELLDGVITELRATAAQMRPATLDLFGLEPTLRQAATSLTAAGVQTTVGIAQLPRLDATEETLLYRAAMFGVAAAARDGVGRAAIDVTHDNGTVEVHVRDDGPTPDPAFFTTPEVRALREQCTHRGWDLAIEPRHSGPGVTVRVTAPATSPRPTN